MLELDAQSLGTLLCSDDLNISQEQVLLELVLRWAQRRRGDLQGETEAAELLRHVRLELVEPSFLRKARRRNPVSLIFPPFIYQMTSTIKDYFRSCCGMLSALG